MVIKLFYGHEAVHEVRINPAFYDTKLKKVRVHSLVLLNRFSGMSFSVTLVVERNTENSFFLFYDPIDQFRRMQRFRQFSS